MKKIKSKIAQIFPLHSNETYFGIDWGHRYVKIVGLQKKGHSFALSLCQLFVVPDEGVTPAFQKKILRSLEKNGAKGQPLSAGMDGPEVNARYVKLPEMPRSEFKKAAIWEVKDQMYFPQEEAILKVVPFGVVPKDHLKRLHGMVFLLHKPFVYEKIDLFHQFPLKLRGVLLNSRAAQLAAAPQKMRQKNVLILTIGSHYTHIAIFQGEAIYFLRELDFGGQALSDEIVSYEGVTPQKAELLKKRLILKPEGLDIRYAPEIQDPDFLFQAFRMPLEKMVDEIRLSVQFYASQVHASVESIFLVGGGSLLRGLDTYIENKLGIRVQKLDPFTGVRIDPEKFEEKKLRAIGPIFASAVGLARHAAGGESKTVLNVLNLVKREEQIAQKQGVLMRVSSLSALMIVLLAALFLSFKTNQIKGEKIVVDKRLENVRYRLSFIKELEKKTGQMSVKFRQLLTEKGQQPRWSLLFKVLSQNIPDQVWITGAQIQPVRSRGRRRGGNRKPGWKMTLSGQAYTGQSIRAFYNALQKQAAFDQVNLRSIVLDEKQKDGKLLRFELTCGIKSNFSQLIEGE